MLISHWTVDTTELKYFFMDLFRRVQKLEMSLCMPQSGRLWFNLFLHSGGSLWRSLASSGCLVEINFFFIKVDTSGI